MAYGDITATFIDSWQLNHNANKVGFWSYGACKVAGNVFVAVYDKASSGTACSLMIETFTSSPAGDITPSVLASREEWLGESARPLWAGCSIKKISSGQTIPIYTDVCSGGTASASDDNPPNETADKAFDGNFSSSKWLSNASGVAWIKYDLGAGNSAIVVYYSITSANDEPTRDPKNWTFEGSNNDVDWTVLDTQTNQSWNSARLNTKTYGPFVNTTAYRYYRLNISASNGASMCQVEELEFCKADGTFQGNVVAVLQGTNGDYNGYRTYITTFAISDDGLTISRADAKVNGNIWGTTILPAGANPHCWPGNHPLVPIAGNNYTFVTFQGNGQYVIHTIPITPAGVVGSVIDTEAVDISTNATGNGGFHACLRRINSTVFGLLCGESAAPVGPTALHTFNITDAGAIGSELDSQAFSTVKWQGNVLFQVNDTVWAVVYNNDSDDATLDTINITAAGIITLIASLTFSTAPFDSGYQMETRFRADVNRFLFFWVGGEAITVHVLNISNNGLTLSAYDTEAGFANASHQGNVLYLGTDYYLLAEEDAGFDCDVLTFKVVTNPSFAADEDRIYVWIGTQTVPETIELTVPTYPTVLGVRTERGKDDELGYAQAGIADIVCDNRFGDFNPDKAAGPFYGVLKLGCAVTVYERYLGVRYDHFRGRLDHIKAHTQPGNRLAYLTALDGMDDLAGVDVDTVLREDTASGVIVADVLTTAIPGGYTSAIDAGDPLDFAWVHKMKALDALRAIQDQEPQSFFYVSETGAYIWEGRIHRQQGAHPTSQATFDNSMLDYIHEVGKRQLWNHVRVRGSQYVLAPTATFLWAASAGDESAPFVPAGGTLDIWADLDVPVNSASVSTGAASIHWNANASPTKSSTDLTADFIVAYTTYGQSVKFTITNNSAQDGYLVIPTSPPAGAPANATLLLYGKLYADSMLTALKTDSTSIADFGSRAKEIECPYISSQKAIEQIGNLVLAKFKDPHPTPVGVRLNARTDESAGGNTTRIQCLTRKISDRITVKADLLGVDQDYFINKIIQDYKFLEGGIHHETEWLLEDLGPAALQKYWLLETVGYGELEQNTILG